MELMTSWQRLGWQAAQVIDSQFCPTGHCAPGTPTLRPGINPGKAANPGNGNAMPGMPNLASPGVTVGAGFEAANLGIGSTIPGGGG